MTREEAINLYWNVRYNLANEKQKAALDLAFSALREQPQWISVEERLPTLQFDTVLAYDGDTKVVAFYNGKFQDSDENGYMFEVRGVTHWMPMPPVPEVEG